LYSVLIAEDEMMFRMMLKSSVNWSKLNMRVVADVSNGADGWAMYQQLKPDIVITDIRMPIMDGIEFIKRIRELENLHAKIVILSCVEDFEMLHQAVHYGVSDYMLKLTMTPADMEGILVKLVKELEQEARKVHRNSQDNLTTYKRWKLDPLKGIVGVMMEIDHYELLQKQSNESSIQLLKMSIMNVLEEIMTGFKLGEPFYGTDSRYFLLANCEHEQSMVALLDHIRKVMFTYFNHSVTFGISDVHAGFDQLNFLYMESEAALEMKFFRGYGACIYYKEIKPIENKQQTIWSYQQKLHWTVFTLRLTGDAVSALVYEYSQSIANSETYEEVQGLFSTFMEQIHELRSHNQMSREVSQVMSWIEERYKENLNLQQIADEVQMSYNYFGMLFKKETGLSFIDYLQQVRIEKARELLLNTNKKMYDIMEDVGYSDQSYFSRSFKKVTGIRPSEFRRSWMKEPMLEPEGI
jgi:two-component system response regulator YesN